MLNCPNCGAPIQRDICPYCGSVFLDWACFDMNRPTFVKVRDHYGHIKLLKIMPISTALTLSDDSCELYADDRIYKRVWHEELKIEAEFVAVPFRHKLAGKEVLCIDIDPDIANDDTIKDTLYNFGDR